MTIDVDVWVFSLDVPDGEVARLGALLNEEERDRVSRIKSPSERQLKLIAHGRKREILAKYTNCDPSSLKFDKAQNGKPYLVVAGQAGPFFNLSHSGSVAAMAVCRAADVGIDIEKLRDVPDGFADRFFAPEERSALATISDPEARRRTLILCWTRKEAVVKATGEGIARGLQSFVVSVNDGPWPEVSSFDGSKSEGKTWCLRHFEPAEGYVGAVAVKAKKTDTRVQFSEI